MAHALLGAIEAKATGTNALAGAAGALTGEAAAQIIAQKLYGIDGKSKTTNDLSESEKQTITALSQLAGGLAGGIIGDSTTSAVSSADIAKRAVENNFTLNPSSDWAVTAEANKQIDDIQRQAVEQFVKEHPKLIETLKTSGDVASFLAGFTPVIGDAKSFAEAEDAIDYVLATFGVIPGAELVTKSLKEVKTAYKLAKNAENIDEANEKLDIAHNLLIQGKQNYEQIWSETKFKKPVPNAYQHWDKHKSEFPNLNNAKEYVDMAHDFIRNPPEGTLVKVRNNGDTIFYNPKLGIFAIKNKDNTPKTMFKPDPKKHGYKTNEDYFNAQ